MAPSLAPLLMLLFSRRPGARIVILYITVLSMIGFASWIYADLIVLHPDRKGFFFIAVNIYQWFFAMLGVLLYAMAGLPQSWRRWVMYGYDPMAHWKNLR
ncbi:MAG: hypothetical protein HYV26_23730 [Candidatus Hydrogenedentes bacterium]|nr:hypothetical protein [Candidatus Hydrogenedentota bacterium]